MKTVKDLVGWFRDTDGVLVSLSGGVDSALVAYAARRSLGDAALAVTADYRTLASDELAVARRVASEIGIRHHVIKYDELESGDFVRNDSRRCFYCRTELSVHLRRTAVMHGLSLIVDGTHADDLGDYRPGIEAMRQDSIRSPLAELGFTKDDVRRCARLSGISVHARPQNACLASRLSRGTRVTARRLAMVEVAERMVRQTVDVGQLRVRHDDDECARIEVDPDKIGTVHGRISEIREKLRLVGFTTVRVDPRGYHGAKETVTRT